MSKKPTALRRLLDRTICPKRRTSEASIQRHKISKAEKKARHRKREEIKQQRVNATRDSQSEEIRNRNAERLSRLRALTAEQQAELERIQNDLANDLVESVTYAKERIYENKEHESDFESDLPSEWRGLPPGLAPVGYEPDSSDDEPY